MSEKKRFRIRDIFLKYPFLDRLRISAFANLFQFGITHVFERTFRIVALISPGAKGFVKTIHGTNELVVESARPCIYAYYHGHMHVLLGLAPRNKMTVLASNSRDGEMIARAAVAMGFSMVRGSKTHGGMKAGLEMITTASEGGSILFNVDGPRGPHQIVKESVIRMAELSGLPIIPLLAIPRTETLMPTWDSYSVPTPGTRMLYVFGEPLEVGRDLSKEQRESLRSQLNDYMAELLTQGKTFWSAPAPRSQPV